MELAFYLERAHEQEEAGEYIFACLSYQGACDEAYCAQDDAMCADILVHQARCYECLGNFKEACVSYNAAWQHSRKLGDEELTLDIVWFLQEAERNADEKQRFDKLDKHCRILCDNNEVGRAEKILGRLLRQLRQQRDCGWFPAAVRLLFGECKMRQHGASSLQEALSNANKACELAVEWPNQACWLLQRISDIEGLCRVRIALQK
jgi:tetratricopeptide (TPR) repeat protein